MLESIAVCAVWAAPGWIVASLMFSSQIRNNAIAITYHEAVSQFLTMLLASFVIGWLSLMFLGQAGSLHGFLLPGKRARRLHAQSRSEFLTDIIAKANIVRAQQVPLGSG